MVQRFLQKFAMYSLPADTATVEESPVAQLEPGENAFAQADLLRIAEQMPAVLWTTDLEMNLTNIQGNNVSRLNPNVHPFPGMAVNELFGIEGGSSPVLAAHVSALGGYAQSFELAVGDAAFWGIVEPLFNADWNLAGTVGVAVDISQRKHFEELHLKGLSRDFETEKRQGLINLASNIAHHFNELFGAIEGYAALVRMGLEPDDPMQNWLREIENAGQCAVDLVHQLLERDPEKEKRTEPVNMTQLIQNQLRTFQAFVSKKITLQCDLEDDVPLVAGDPGQLRRLLVNLLFNAAAAVGVDAGAISLRTQRTHGIPSVLEGGTEEQNEWSGDEFVWLQVSDTGRGLDEADKAKIFEPFAGFSGHGIGLEPAAKIVRAHHGKIGISSKPGLGTTCHILLPVLHEGADVLPPENFF
jgi:signal transduction histidine kinase